MNGLEEAILSGIKLALRESVPENTKAIASQNILKAVELDCKLQLGIFSSDEVDAIIKAEKAKYFNKNRDIKQKIKKASK